MQEIGENIRRSTVDSELDIHHFQRTTVEEPVALMTERMFKNEALRKEFCQKGRVWFGSKPPRTR